MIIIKSIIPVKPNTNPNYARVTTRGIVLHHTACPFVPAKNFYSALKNVGNSYDERRDDNVYHSFHSAVDFNGDILQFIEWQNRAFASGSYKYSSLGKRKFSSDASKYTIDIEMCCQDRDTNYQINKIQIESTIELCVELCLSFSLDPGKDIHRHMDIAQDKAECPLYLREDKKWLRLIYQITKRYKKKQEYIVKGII